MNHTNMRDCAHHIVQIALQFTCDTVENFSPGFCNSYTMFASDLSDGLSGATRLLIELYVEASLALSSVALLHWLHHLQQGTALASCYTVFSQAIKLLYSSIESRSQLVANLCCNLTIWVPQSSQHSKGLPVFMPSQMSKRTAQQYNTSACIWVHNQSVTTHKCYVTKVIVVWCHLIRGQDATIPTPNIPPLFPSITHSVNCFISSLLTRTMQLHCILQVKMVILK